VFVTVLMGGTIIRELGRFTHIYRERDGGRRRELSPGEACD
jgi:hypothetical protein